MDYKRLGERIREERIKLHMTQETLAEAVGISTVYAGQIERSERKLSIDNLVAIANALHISVESLLRDSLEHNTEMIDNEIIALIKERTFEEKRLILDTIRAVLNRIENNILR